MTTRKYSSRSQQTTLTSAVTSGATVLPVANATTLLGGATVSTGQTFTVVIDPDTALEEIVDVTVVSGNNLTVTRDVDMAGASAQDHSAGAVIRHMIIGRDLRESNLHVEASAAYNDGTGTHALHGLASGDGSVVGTTATQSLSNKTLASDLAAGGFKVTGLATPTASGDAATKNYVDTSPNAPAAQAATSAASAATSATAAATSATSAAASATAAATSATSSAASATAANTSAVNALSYSTSASTSATAAATSATSAAVSATAAATSATSAAASATAAATSATSAAAYVSTVAASATAAATSANSAATSATSAAASATAASTSATSAAASYTSITDQTGRGLVRDMGSITDADTTTDTYVGITAQVTQATQQATAATTSATSAAASATAAATSATLASTYVSNASTQATAAATSATSAAASATAAATSATSAAASATAASTSASSAATSASSAASAATAALATKVSIAGDTMTGQLILSGNPTSALGAAPKQYVDLVTAGINFHPPVVAASVSNLSVVYNNGTSGIGATLTADTNRAFSTLDGQTVSVGGRVLIKDQTTQLQNGIYTLTTVGSGSVPWVLTRTTDADNSVAGEMANGDVIFATGGTVNAGKTFVNSSTGTITIGTTAITYSAYYAGLPAQTGSAGYFLTTDGTTPSWASLSDWGTV
jgi:hypothetical protein